MPIYEYTCQSCQKKFDHLHRSMSTTEKVKCPECGSTKTERALSVFAVGAEAPKASKSSAPHMCGRCGGPGPCAMGS